MFIQQQKELNEPKAKICENYIGDDKNKNDALNNIFEKKHENDTNSDKY